jgi:hypothetical protein
MAHVLHVNILVMTVHSVGLSFSHPSSYRGTDTGHQLLENAVTRFIWCDRLQNLLYFPKYKGCLLTNVTALPPDLDPTRVLQGPVSDVQAE